MLRFDAATAECLVFTYKEGLLSAVAHDLKLAVTRFTVEVDREKRAVSAQFDAASLRVLSAMREGQPAPQLLADSDRRKIEHTIVTEVLAARTHPQILFVSTEVISLGDGPSSGFKVKGRLTLYGQTREIFCNTRATSDRHIAEVVLHQPDFGIRPYTALLGTLRIRPDVTVRLSIPRS